MNLSQSLSVHQKKQSTGLVLFQPVADSLTLSLKSVPENVREANSQNRY